MYMTIWLAEDRGYVVAVLCETLTRTCYVIYPLKRHSCSTCPASASRSGSIFVYLRLPADHA